MYNLKLIFQDTARESSSTIRTAAKVLWSEGLNHINRAVIEHFIREKTPFGYWSKSRGSKKSQVADVQIHETLDGVDIDNYYGCVHKKHQSTQNSERGRDYFYQLHQQMKLPK